MPSSNRMNWPFPTENQTPWYEAFEDLIAAQDTSSFAARDDRNLVIAGGGNLSWTVATSTFQWTADIRVLSPITGGLLTIPAAALVLDDGDAVFVNLVRAVSPSNTLSPQLVRRSRRATQRFFSLRAPGMSSTLETGSA